MSLPSPDDSAKFSSPIDLPLVRRLFSTPARVAGSDFLRREVAARMLERMLLVKIAPQRMLDAGCGEGADIVSLQQRFADARIIGLDSAFNMLVLARERRQMAQSAIDRLLTRWLPSAGPGSGGALVCADFARLPFGAHALDMVWSNLALHWHPQPDRVFAEWRRVLQIEGLLMFSCFGPDTFRELRIAFERIDAVPHSLPFVDMHDLGDMLVHAGFSTPVMEMENITVTYDTPLRLLTDLRAWGGNPLESRRRGLLGRAAYARLLHALEQQRDADGRIPLTFEVIYGHAFRPPPRTTAGMEAIIHFEPRS